MKLNKIRNKLLTLTPLVGLLFLIILYVFSTGGNVTWYGLKILLNQTVITAIVSTGAIFIYTIGAFDISLGAAVAVSAMTGALVYNATQSIIFMFITCLIVAVCIGLLNSVLASVFNLPVFVTTIVMLSILNSLINVLVGSTGGGSIIVPAEAVEPWDSVWIKAGFLVSYMLICIFLFDFTSIGRKMKFLGGNSICAFQSGIRSKKMAIVAFAIAGVGVGLSALLTVVRAPTLSTSTASRIGMDVIIAIVFGGMPLSGGSGSKISAAFIGSMSMVLLSQILIAFGFDTGVSQLIKAVLFLIVVSLASFSYRGKLLPR